MELSIAATGPICDIAGETPGSMKAANLVEEYAWSERKMLTRNQQWNVWLEFSNSDDRHPLPVSEAHFAVYVGWIMMEQQGGGHHVGSVSIQQYPRTVR